MDSRIYNWMLVMAKIFCLFLMIGVICPANSCPSDIEKGCGPVREYIVAVISEKTGTSKFRRFTGDDRPCPPLRKMEIGCPVKKLHLKCGSKHVIYIESVQRITLESCDDNSARSTESCDMSKLRKTIDDKCEGDRSCRITDPCPEEQTSLYVEYTCGGYCTKEWDCLNGGTCAKEGELCYCMDGFAGAQCEIDCSKETSDLCGNDRPCPYCANGGKCDGKSGICNCPLPFAGVSCRHTVCGKCHNGRKCERKQVNKEYKYICFCGSGYRGTRCEENLCGECLSGGTCVKEGNEYKCACTPGVYGLKCESINRCYNVNCKNGGYCRGGLCICPKDYAGDRCGQVNYCKNVNCQHGGYCDNLKDSFKCICTVEYTGKYCENVTFCHGVTCQNGGTCTDLKDSFQCICPINYRGKYCESVNYCHNVTCQNRGYCKNVNDSFKCICGADYSGEFCEDEPCLEEQCLNGGICEDGYCECRGNYEGDRCEQPKIMVKRFCVNEDFHLECKRGFVISKMKISDHDGPLDHHTAYDNCIGVPYCNIHATYESLGYSCQRKLNYLCKAGRLKETSCPGETLHLECGPGYIISIKSAVPVKKLFCNSSTINSESIIDTVRHILDERCSGARSCDVPFRLPVNKFNVAINYTCEEEQEAYACENETLHLECKRGFVISFSMTLKTVCGDYAESSYCPDVLDLESQIIRRNCRGLPSCDIPVAKEWFGDTCPQIKRAISVHYTCQARRNETSSLRKTLHLDCGPGNLIFIESIVRVSKGDGDDYPPRSTISTKPCLIVDVFPILHRECNGVRTCDVPDLCPGQTKYYEVAYTCEVECFPRCLNGGICTNMRKCICPANTLGLHCEIYFPEKETCGENKSCLNGGTCLDGNCICSDFYTGDLCELFYSIKEQHCGENVGVCLNGGECCFDMLGEGTTRCMCSDHYTGDLCERFQPMCEENKCMNGGTCIQDLGLCSYFPK